MGGRGRELSERTDTRRVKERKKTGKGRRPRVAAVRGGEGKRTGQGNMRGGEDWTETGPISSLRGISRAWVLPGFGLCDTGHILAKGILENTSHRYK